MRYLFVFVVLLSAGPAIAGDCPKRPGASELTLNQVMYHFGKGVRIAGTMARNGSLDPASVTEADRQATIDILEIGKTCVDVVISDQTGALYPSRARQLSGQALADYIKEFYRHMQIFKTELTELQDLFRAPHPDYPALLLKEKEVNQAAEDAHEVLG